MKRRALFYAVIGLISLLVFTTLADEWQWHRIAWEGIQLESVICPPDSEHVVYVSTSYRDVPEEEWGVYKSTDNGLTWRFLEESNGPFTYAVTIDPKDPETIFCGFWGIFMGDAPWRSRDAGETWERTMDNWTRYMPSPWEQDLIFATYSCGSYALLRSTDDGATWNWIDGAEAPIFCDRVVYHHEDSLMVFACLFSPMGLCRSSDRGETWELVLEGEVSAFDNDPADPHHWIAFVVVSSQSLWPQFAESFDDGMSWELWDFPYDVWTGRQMVFDLFDSRTIYIASAPASPENLGILRSTDGGVTWDPMNDGLTELLGPCELFLSRARPGEMLAARRDGLWRWTDQVIGETPGGPVSGTLRIESVSPCPFQGRMEARYILARSSVVRARVYSIDGALVRYLLDYPFENGTHSFKWDGRDAQGRDVAAGAYVLTINTDDEQAIRRVVKLR